MSKRITIQDLNSYRFLKIPKELIFNIEKYNKLSPEAILLYGLLHDRLELSAKNGWVNENGEVYLKFKKEVVMKLLRIGSKTTITKVFKELKTFKLIEEKQMGCNIANEIYLLQAEFSPFSITDEEILDLDKKNNENMPEHSKINGSTKNGHPKSVRQEVQKVYTSDTNYNHTNSIEEVEEASEPEKEIIELFKEVKPGEVTKFDKKILKELLGVYDASLIKKAIEIFGRFSGKSIEYLKTTLRNWKEQGLKTPEEIEMKILMLQEKSNKASENRRKNIERMADKKAGSNNSYGKNYIDGVKQDSFNSYKQREYNFDALERELLGWDE